MSAVAALVTPPPPLSALQGASAGVVVWNLARARREFKALEEWLLSEDSCQLPLHEVEREQERRAREIQRLLLEAHVAQRGTGDVGPAVAVNSPAAPDQPALHSHRRLDPRHPQPLFGEITIQRPGYRRPGGSAVHPLDDQLQLPQRSFSYELQRRLVQAAVQGPFEEATAWVADATGVTAPKRSAEQVVRDAARAFEAFYQARIPPPAGATGPILVASRDGKGVPMVQAAPASRVARRGKGEKAQQKKMAVVATVYTQQPRVRSPEEVVASLFAMGPRPADEPIPVWPRPEYKRVWASLTKGRGDVLGEVRQELLRRDPAHTKHWVVLTDGERALPQSVKRRLRGIPLVLDFQPGLAKLWQAAYAFHDEGSPQAMAWVKERAWRLLHGEVSQVVQGMRQRATKRALRRQRRKAVEAAAGYFYRNRRPMQYHEYLRQGWPLATGVVEGACKSLIKDRMERSGMRWTVPMAEAMLKLRATYLSGDFEEYWAFHIHQDQQRVHPPETWQPVKIVDEK
jgi:hypothetical protein